MRTIDMLPRCVKTHKIMNVSKTAAVQHIKDKTRHGKGNPDYSVYPCGSCGAWHVGHSVVKFKKRIKRATRVGDRKSWEARKARKRR